MKGFFPNSADNALSTSEDVKVQRVLMGSVKNIKNHPMREIASHWISAPQRTSDGKETVTALAA